MVKDIVLRTERSASDDPLLNPWVGIDGRMDIRDALSQLTDKQREALALWVEGYTQEEIGEALGITQRNAGRRIERAIARIREILDLEWTKNAFTIICSI